MAISDKKAVSPVIAIVLLLMMTVAAAGAAYFWITSMQSSVQQSAGSQIEAITKQASTRIIAQATICKGINEVNLVGYWKMDEGSGDYANDLSKYENDGTLEDFNLSDTESPQGPTWTDNGKVGQALDFDGSDDYVEVDNMKMDGSRTIAFWFNPDFDYNNGKDHTLFRWKYNSDNNIFVGKGDDNELRLIGRSTTDPWWYIGVDQEFYKGNWHHITAVKDEANDVAKFYFDGKQIGEVSSIGTMTSNTAEICLGSRGGWDCQCFSDGKMDEVRIYDRALSKAQVEYLNDTNKAMGRYVNITVYNAGTEEVPKGAWVANLKKDGTTVDSDSYNASKLPSEDRITLNFYFDKMKPNKEYTIELEGTQTSTTVSC